MTLVKSKKKLEIFGLTSEVKHFLNIVISEGFSLTLVGGASRDYFLKNRLPFDLDFELRGSETLDEEEWSQKIRHLLNILQKSFQIEFLPFLILRVKVGDYDIELSSPRIEVYQEKEFYGHSDFQASCLPGLEFEKSFSRRDFTINAIGIQWSEDYEIIDPFNGLDDLQSMILRPCGYDFFKDPVRFLRMIRFKLKFDAVLAPELEENLQEFNIRGLSFFYLFKEAVKSQFFPFFNEFFSLISKYK